jgi:glutathione S-transferase
MNHSENILYSFRRCPFAIRARMALSYADAQYQHREILLKNKPQSMLDYSKKATVPVLVTNGSVIDESLDVMQWALSINDKDNWLLKDNQNKKTEMLGLIDICDNQFKPVLDLYKYSDRHIFSEIYYRDQTLWFIELLNSKLKENKYLFSNHISLADIAIFPFIRQYAFVNKKWFDETLYTYLINWLNRLLSSELFIKIMTKHKLWVD